ncbi:hypothetical protein B0T18DRAFT_412888 [Schizothecium vesticola]|uniref:Uncharacterized protein n=1 Tax=Schizothecium vesticola TaxID=314040 RepID=A0AA40K5S0_9PEZI|nr:hypothetical protein B0T18DRAFT_412888 [Schizothecium vesticola]
MILTTYNVDGISIETDKSTETGDAVTGGPVDRRVIRIRAGQEPIMEVVEVSSNTNGTVRLLLAREVILGDGEWLVDQAIDMPKSPTMAATLSPPHSSLPTDPASRRLTARVSCPAPRLPPYLYTAGSMECVPKAPDPATTYDSSALHHPKHLSSLFCHDQDFGRGRYLGEASTTSASGSNTKAVMPHSDTKRLAPITMRRSDLPGDEAIPEGGGQRSGARGR